jgi:hypothetical protein
MKKFPFIIIFDIDNTIIGDESNLIDELNLIRYIYNICKKKGINSKCFSIDLVDIQDELKNGLLRPYVSDFVRFCNTKFKNVEVFFYTGYSWTNLVIGKNVEKALKIKINRPFFSRAYSMNSKKSLANTYPMMIKSLVSRYPSLKDADVSEYILKNRTIFIDDTANNLFAYTDRQFICPVYNAAVNAYDDIYDKLIRKYKFDPKVFDDKDILEYLHDNNILVYNANGNEFQKNKEYIAIAKTYHAIKKEIEKSEEKQSEDTYFKDLIAELSNKKISNDILTDKNIAMMNGKLLSRGTA